MLQRLFSRVMQNNPINQCPGMSAATQAMLRRPATAHLEAGAEALDEGNAAAAAMAAAASANTAEAPKQALAGTSVAAKFRQA